MLKLILSIFYFNIIKLYLLNKAFLINIQFFIEIYHNNFKFLKKNNLFFFLILILS